MVMCFHRLSHTPVARGNHTVNHIGYLRPTGTHGSKGFVARCIQESDRTASVNFHFISTYVLCDAASFSGDHIRLTDMVQQRSFPMVHMAHYGNDGVTGNQGFRLIFLFDHVILVGCDEVYIETKRSEEHTSELQSLMRISYAVFCLKKKKTNPNMIEKYIM